MSQKQTLRADLERIASWVQPHARVLDLGCGDGKLIAYLGAEKSCTGIGVEINDERVIACVNRGVNVIQQNLEDGLALFQDGQFDTVVLSQTLQAVLRTERILLEMARVGKECIVSFPNFGHWSHIWALSKGRMPVTGQMPYQWYDTPNIHLCTLNDFEDLVKHLGLRILERATFAHGKEVDWMPGLRATLAVYRFTAAC